MKKLFSAILCASLISFNLICFAAETSMVKVNTTNVPLKSKLLKKKYSAYEISLQNVSSDALKVNNISVLNAVNDGEKLNNSYRFISPLSATLTAIEMGSIAAVPFTFGLSLLVALPCMGANTIVTFVDLNNTKKSTAEAVKYNTNKLVTYKEQVIMPDQNVNFGIAVPLGQTPNMEITLENIRTHEYINVAP